MIDRKVVLVKHEKSPWYLQWILVAVSSLTFGLLLWQWFTE